MKIETRQFKHAEFMLLIPETEAERLQLDRLGDAADHEVDVTGKLVCDDSFMPYLRFKL